MTSNRRYACPAARSLLAPIFPRFRAGDLLVPSRAVGIAALDVHSAAPGAGAAGALK